MGDGNEAVPEAANAPRQLGGHRLTALEGYLVAPSPENLVHGTGRLDQVVSRQAVSSAPVIPSGPQGSPLWSWLHCGAGQAPFARGYTLRADRERSQVWRRGWDSNPRYPNGYT